MTCHDILKGIFKPSSWKKRNKAAKEADPSSAPALSASRKELQKDTECSNKSQALLDETEIPRPPQSKTRDSDQETSHHEIKELNEPKVLSIEEEQIELSERLHDNTLHNGLWEAAYRKVEQILDETVLAQFVKLLLEAEISQDERGTSQDDADKKVDEGNLEKLQDIVKRKLDVIQNSRLVIRGRVVRDEVSEIFGTIKMFKDIITAAVSAEPHAALAWGCVAGFFPLLDNALTQFGNAQTGLKIISEILVRCRVMEATPLISRGPAWSRSPERQRLLSQVRDKTIDLYSHILQYQILLASQYSRSSIKRLLRNVILKDDWKTMYGKLQETETSIMSDLKVLDRNTAASVDYKISNLQKATELILSRTMEVHEDIKRLTQDALIRELPEAQYAAYDTYRKNMPPPPYCHEDTRRRILYEIQQWGKGGDDNCIFWLRGMAGTGKSTIARTAAKMFNDQLLLGASFFFSRTNADRASPDKLIPTLARQLADVLPGFAAHLKDSIQRNHNVTQRSLNEQWECLLRVPLSALSDKSSHPSVRPEAYLADGFNKIPSTTYYDVMIDSTGDEATERDIRIFLEDKLSEIATRKQFNGLTHEAWPGKERADKLIERSGRLFIAAATACRFLEDSEFIDDNLNMLLSTDKHDESLTWDIDEMYRVVLRQAIPERGPDRKRLLSLFQLVVGSIITMPEALPLGSLAILLRTTCEDIRITLKNLSSVLVVPEDDNSQVALFHLSFRDFLVDPNRCKDMNFFIDEQQANNKLFHRCMDILHEKDNLRRNICNIQHPGMATSEVSQDTINKQLPQEVQYACWHWGTHINCVESIRPGEAARLLTFLKEHFTHWLEALSLTRRMVHASPTMTVLKTRVAVEDHQELSEFVSDGNQFVNYYGTDIADAPLQVYYSGLIFSPTSSVLRKQYHKETPQRIRLVSTVHDSWGQSERIISCTGPTTASFSPDSTRIAIGNALGDIMVWNLITGQLEQLLRDVDSRDDFSEVSGLLFSPSGRGLMAVYDNKTVSTFSLLTGHREQRKPLPVDVEGSTVIGLLPDSRMITLLTERPRALCLCNTDTDETKTIHGQFVIRALSTNGKFIVSGLHDRITLSKIISRESGVCDTEKIYACEVEHDPKFNAAFSPDSKRVAVSFDHDMVQIWDINGEPQTIIRSLSGNVMKAAFSPDGTRLALSTEAGPIEIWNLLTQHATHRLEDHSGGVETLAFSPDGRRLLSLAYNEHRVRTWDLHGSRAVNQRPGLTKYSTCRFAAFSPDSKYAALITDDCFEVLDTTTWKPNIVLESQDGVAASFSPEGTKVAFQNDDGILRVYDIATGKEEHASPEKTPRSEVLAFSPNGGMVASSSGRYMTIWSFGKEPKQYESGIGYGDSRVLVFSTSGKQIATGCNKGYVRIFDLTTGEVLTRDTGYESPLFSLAFAPDDTRIAAKGIDSVYIWDMAKEEPIKQFDCYYSISTQRLFLDWERTAMYTVDSEKKWVTYNGERFLAIPADFRPSYIEPLSATSLLLMSEKSALGTLHFPPEPDLDNI
ncbi:hypothetical protein AbraIFM66950_011975 [Aspergillus brasiliensis]|nr:hypothetical protein AbraIFM66950_011975 [Aspergillus brasiliensis]